MLLLLFILPMPRKWIDDLAIVSIFLPHFAICLVCLSRGNYTNTVEPSITEFDAHDYPTLMHLHFAVSRRSKAKVATATLESDGGVCVSFL